MLSKSIKKENKTYNDNIKNLINTLEGDILYLDPPYNEREYSSYYHVLETISNTIVPLGTITMRSSAS